MFPAENETALYPFPLILRCLLFSFCYMPLVELSWWGRELPLYVLIMAEACTSAVTYAC